MTRGRTALAIAGGAVALAVGATGAVVATQDSTATLSTTVTVPAPQNLRVVEVGPDHVKVSYGPTIVGPMNIYPAANGRSAKITWGGATDDLYPLGITYQFKKNGIVLWSGRQQTYANVGFTLKVRQFTTCVTPHSQSGFGPERCVTWQAPP